MFCKRFVILTVVLVLMRWQGVCADTALLTSVTATSLSASQTQMALLFDKKPSRPVLSEDTSGALKISIESAGTKLKSFPPDELTPLIKDVTVDESQSLLVLKIALTHKVKYDVEMIGNNIFVNLDSSKNDEKVENKNPTNQKNELINLDFEDVPVRSVLQFISQFSSQDILISESVKGSITLKLTDVSWRDALSIVLRTQGLIARKVGKALYIAPAQDLAENDKKELKVEDDLRNLAPLKTKVFHVKYGRAESYFDTLRNPVNSLLSARGRVILNKRTNILFIEDTQEKLRAIERYVETTDIPVRQVEIEARIVTIDKSFEQQLGIKWNVAGQTLSNPSGATAHNRFNLDLIGDKSTAGGFSANSLALATISNDVLIGMELAALEAEGGGEILSSPRLLTADQQEAVIQQGSEIPYQESTAGGGTSVTFKQAVLRLRVTPQITPNDKIMLQLQVNQDAPGEVIKGVPMIDTRQISSYVLVNNGQTIVLGGIYERTKSHANVRIPFLGDLPLVGALFRHRSSKDNRKELLIFVTPKIVKDVE